MTITMYCTPQEVSEIKSKFDAHESVELFDKSFWIRQMSCGISLYNSLKYEVKLELEEVWNVKTTTLAEQEKELPEEFYFKCPGSSHLDYLYKAKLVENSYHISWKEDTYGYGVNYAITSVKENVKDGYWVITELTAEQILAAERYTHYKAKMEAAKKDMEYWEERL